ncbi:hypothetical protein [Aeromonas veronii]|uniref:hypothetical protein n=1 Tax=Aeromonas veronii TaxID=654 RepID=UPI003D241458
MKTIQEFILNCGQNIHARMMLIIWTLGDWNEQRKKTKAEKRYQKALNQFKFVLSPSEVLDRIVIFKGGVYRIQFQPDGFTVHDELNDKPVNDPLRVIQLLSEIQK